MVFIGTVERWTNEGLVLVCDGFIRSNSIGLFILMVVGQRKQIQRPNKIE